MTFDNAAWAINGPLTGSALARRAEYAATSGTEGIVSKGDFAVSAMVVPGVGIRIAPGVGVVLNKYQTAALNESYVVTNYGSYTVPAEDMPASNPAAKSYIVAVVVGDPDFSQVGHPWMLATDPPDGEEETFEYVRPTIIPVSAGAKTLSGAYPALVLARIDVPANTTTITNAMITDLRSLAQPRQSQEIFVSSPTAWTGLTVRAQNSGAFADWGPGQFSPTVDVPSWATRAIVTCYVNGARIADTSLNVFGGLRAQLGAVSGQTTNFDFPAQVGAVRAMLMAAGEYDVTSIQGSTVNLRVEAYQSFPASATNNQRLTLQTGSQQIFDVRFFEE